MKKQTIKIKHNTLKNRITKHKQTRPTGPAKKKEEDKKNEK